MVKYKVDSLTNTFHALADPTRRAILSHLARGEAYVGELAEPFSMSLPAITKHLNVLESAGLVHRHKEGRLRRCQLDAEPMRQASDWIREHHEFWEMQLDQLENYLQQTSTETDQEKEKSHEPGSKNR